MWNSIFFNTCQKGAVNPTRQYARIVELKKKFYMKWLTIDYIKFHSRIDFDCENELLELYGEDAEETVLNLCNRTMEDIIEQYGQVPKPLFVAALMLVETSYTQRAPISIQNLYTVPYAFDMKVKPYMKLT